MKITSNATKPQPLMLSLREEVIGVVVPGSHNSGEDPTFMGATQNNGADYETD